MILRSWCPERHDQAFRDHKKSGQIVMSRYANSHNIVYILPTTDESNEWATASACDTYMVMLNRNIIIPLFFLLCVFYSGNIFVSPIDRVWRAYVCVVIGTTKIFMQKIPTFYDTAKSSIAVAHRRYCQEDPYYSVSSVHSWRTRWHLKKKQLYQVFDIILSSICRRRTRCIDQQQQRQPVASTTLATTQQRARNTTTNLIMTPIFRSASTSCLRG